MKKKASLYWLPQSTPFSRPWHVYKPPQPKQLKSSVPSKICSSSSTAPLQFTSTEYIYSFSTLSHLSSSISRFGKMSRPGDWNCRSCQHLNFQRRDSCQRCREPRPGSGERGDFYGSFGGRAGGSSSFVFNTGPDVRPGDWYCTVGNCGAHNFASRSSCYKCGASKDELSSGGLDSEMSRMRGFGFGGGSTSRSGWKTGDWICTRSGCNEHNFASRTECYRCNAPRDSASRSSY